MSFATDSDAGNRIKLSSLAMIAVVRHCFEYGFYMGGNLKSSFIANAELSNVVVLMRSAQDTKHAQKSYEHVREINGRRSCESHTMLVEIV